MKCPRDHTQLLPVTNSGYRADRCPTCGGLFIPLNQERAPKILLNRFSPADESAVSLDKEALSPADGKPMLLLLYQGIEIDYCAGSNSVWLDRGELGKLVPGGVAKKKTGKKKGADEERGVVDFVAEGLFQGVFELLGSLWDGF